MLTPQVGRGSGRRRLAIAAFTAGLVAGGAFAALLAWLLSGLGQGIPVPWRTAALVVAALVALLRDAGMLKLSLPQPLRQVPGSIFEKGLVRGSLQFGFELGTGLRTYITASTPYLLLLAVLLAAVSAPVALLAGVGFGLGRAAVPLLRLASQHPREWDRRMTAQAHRLVLACTAASLLAILAIANATPS